MRKPQPQPITLPSATVYSLADYRTSRAVVKLPLPAFPPTDRPGMDFNEIGRTLTTLAKMVREGSISQKVLTRFLDGLAVNAKHACRRGHDLELNLLLAERVLSPKLGGA